MTDLASRVASRFRTAAGGSETDSFDVLLTDTEDTTKRALSGINVRLEKDPFNTTVATSSWTTQHDGLTFKGTTTDDRSFVAKLRPILTPQGTLRLVGDVTVTGSANLTPFPKEADDLFLLIEGYFKTLESLGGNMRIARSRWDNYHEAILAWKAGSTTHGKFNLPIRFKNLGASIRLDAAKGIELDASEIRSQVPLENGKAASDILTKIKRRMLDLGKIIESLA